MRRFPKLPKRPAHSVDGLSSDGNGGIVAVHLAEELGMSDDALLVLEAQVETLRFEGLLDTVRAQDYEIAQILAQHLTHEERMCALHLIFGAETAPCSGKALCKLKERVHAKLRRFAALQPML